MYWTPAKMLLLADVGEYSFANAENHICQALPKVNTLRLRQNGRLFLDNIFKCIFLNENIFIATKISQKFILEGPINNIPALVQIMAWCRSHDKPLSESMLA